MTPEDLAQFSAIVAERLDRAVEALTANLSDLRQEITTRLDTIERRTERTETNVNSVLMQLAGISRSLTVGEQFTSQFAITQSAQQRAIDQIVARLTKLERDVHPEQQ
jgi:quinol monooxygenase YgiN